MGGGATGVASSGWSDGIPLERKTKAKYKRKHGSIPCHLITIYGRSKGQNVDKLEDVVQCWRIRKNVHGVIVAIPHTPSMPAKYLYPMLGVKRAAVQAERKQDE